MIIGLGDPKEFLPKQMELIGSIVFREAARLGVAHPYFAPTILDGGVSKYGTGEISEPFYAGFLRGARTETTIRAARASHGQEVADLTYLAGAAHAEESKQGIVKAIAAAPR
jgi:hypothetical protein